MDSVLVTGSEGFIGGALSAGLKAAGYDVIPFDLRLGQDVTDEALLEAALAGADGVVHLGSPSSALMYVEGHEQAWSQSVAGLTNILKNFRGRVVFPSTCTLYGDSRQPVTEGRQLPHPPNAYAAAKVECERLCFLYNLKGADVKVLRIFTGYGPGEWYKGAYSSPLTRFLRYIAEGERPVVYGDGRQIRDFVFVDDIVAALIRALETDSEECLFNIGTGRGSSFLEVINLLNREVGARAEPYFVAPPAGYVASVIADVGLARRELGYAPEVRLEEGVRRTVHELRTKFGVL
ncbi:MAG TPA: NAD(P)-dependent oxidoreductase [Pyrinomonadaceae bacterium]|nr:NAD(P)-dependent oxidoreductase [Pyrinomonadaceae bacterium]